jgi:NADH-quinone oxidoreductase subunit J
MERIIMNIELKEIVFLCVAIMTILPCFIVAFSRNILHSAFALFFTFLGTSGLYFFLDADFLAVVQVIIYIGGVLVLLLFAILLTRNIEDIKTTNSLSIKRSVLAGIVSLIIIGGLLYSFISSKWVFPLRENPDYPYFTIKELGDLLLTKYLLPFEVVSILLLAVLIGSLVIANRSVR